MIVALPGFFSYLFCKIYMGFSVDVEGIPGTVFHSLFLYSVRVLSYRFGNELCHCDIEL